MLKINYNNKNIGQVDALTIDENFDFLTLNLKSTVPWMLLVKLV